jgi:cysteine-S-conjugate beta-lyase
MTRQGAGGVQFDTVIDRIGSHSSKWDTLTALYGLDPRDGLAMWVADMDFRPPAAVQDALQKLLDHGVYGYFGDHSRYLAAIQWWMAERHGWAVDGDAILTTNGLVNGAALCIDAFTKPGDGVVLMTPVYHAFARVIKAAGRAVVECPLALVDGRHQMDFDAWDAQMTGRETMLILCSPHNPGGRVWTEAELRETAAFCRRHDLILVSDEIHHDLVYPGQKHRVMANVMPDMLDRLVVMSATTKTFNIAGCYTGNVIVPDPALRARLAGRMAALGIAPNSFGLHMVTAAYSPEGALWVDDLMRYLDGNRRLFDAALNAIPGVRSMPLEATYLAWVDFAGTGMAIEEILARVQGQARIATNPGPSFGTGGQTSLRFNIAAPRSMIVQAVERLQAAFADLQ